MSGDRGIADARTRGEVVAENRCASTLSGLGLRHDGLLQRDLVPLLLLLIRSRGCGRRPDAGQVSLVQFDDMMSP
jgi:hypothetical protein